mmetsp:Transcript_18816/g.29146  ORF Transcript_18816/g.29146 Transcript_18816/m.29146 type:complete len:272 (+) Transcript_18816:65-880(+)
MAKQCSDNENILSKTEASPLSKDRVKRELSRSDLSQASTINEDSHHEEAPVKKKRKKKPHKINLDDLQDFNKVLKKRGIVYIARIPPRMGPAKVKTLLSDFGEVTRVYLVEEDKAASKRRKKAGGSHGKRYIEGWVEFANKKVAKQVGEELNNTPISNKKRDKHYGEIWNVKYLRKFMWSHLTEKVAYERRVREQKLRVEMMQAKRENAAYAKLVEAGEAFDHIQARRSKRNGKTDDIQPKRRFHQQAPIFEKDERKKGGAAKKAVLESLV